MSLACGQNVVIRLGLLKNKPHAFNIIACVPPVASGVEISKIKLFLVAAFDRRDCARDLARHEGFTARWSFMIEKDAVGGMHAVGFSIIYSHPIGVKLGRHKATVGGTASFHFVVLCKLRHRVRKWRPDRT